MAKRTIMTDDLNGDEDAATVVITVNGKGIEVDLALRSVDRLTKALAPFWQVGTEHDYDVTPRLGRQQRSKPASPSANGQRAGEHGVDPQDVRRWAAANGVELSAYGRIPRDVVEQYRRST